MVGPMRLVATSLVAILVAFVAAVAAAEDVRPFERASHLRRSSWVLWSPHSDARAALVNTESGGFQEIEVGGFSHPWRFLPVPDGESAAWLYALDRRQDGDVALSRIRLEGGGGAEVLRVYRGTGEGRVAPWLSPGPEGTILIAVCREGGWWVEVMDPLSAAVMQPIGPLPEAPRDAVSWTQGRWLILDESRLWSWPNGETFLYRTGTEPPLWDDPPPTVRWTWPESLILLTEERWLASSAFSLFEVEGDYQWRIAGAHRQPREQVDGPAREAAVGFLGRPFRVGDRTFVWERGGQRLLRLYVDDTGWRWCVQTLWRSPTHAFAADGAAGDPPASGGLPLTVDEVLAGWEGMPFVDVEGETAASFLANHRHEMFVLASQPERAIPGLLEQGSGPAALALALLRAEQADGWFRELVADRTEYRWDGGSCSYPQSSVGIIGLRHLHGRPPGDLIRLRPAERKQLKEALEASESQQDEEAWCGDSGYARQLLTALESK